MDVEKVLAFDFKFKAEMFYKTKGHLNVTRETVEGMFDGYFKRAWINEEFGSSYRTDGFEEAYKSFLKRIV